MRLGGKGGGGVLPNFRLLLNEPLHQVPAPNRVEDDDLDSALFQVRLAAEEALVFADDDARDAEEDACASTFLFPSYKSACVRKGNPEYDSILRLHIIPTATVVEETKGWEGGCGLADEERDQKLTHIAR